MVWAENIPRLLFNFVFNKPILVQKEGQLIKDKRPS